MCNIFDIGKVIKRDEDLLGTNYGKKRMWFMLYVKKWRTKVLINI